MLGAELRVSFTFFRPDERVSQDEGVKDKSLTATRLNEVVQIGEQHVRSRNVIKSRIL